MLRRVASSPGIAVLHWLYQLLLQPDKQLKSLLSPSNTAAESSSAADVDFQQHLTQLGLAGDDPELSGSAAAASKDWAGVQAGLWWKLRVAGSRAAAAYNLLAAAILQQQEDVVRWLLARLEKMTAAGAFVELRLVAQQSLAWDAMAGGQHWVPLLILAAMSGNEHIHKVSYAPQHAAGSSQHQLAVTSPACK